MLLIYSKSFLAPARAIMKVQGSADKASRIFAPQTPCS